MSTTTRLRQCCRAPGGHRFSGQGDVGLVADGAGVTTEEGDVVGVTVGCGVLVLDAGLVGVVRVVGLGEARLAGLGALADRDGEGTVLAGTVDGAGVRSVVSDTGLKFR
jgi:hypothetical protein